MMDFYVWANPTPFGDCFSLDTMAWEDEGHDFPECYRCAVHFQYNFEYHSIYYLNGMYDPLRKILPKKDRTGYSNCIELMLIRWWESVVHEKRSILSAWNSQPSKWRIREDHDEPAFFVEWVHTDYRFRYLRAENYLKCKLSEYIEFWGALTVKKLRELPYEFQENIKYLFNMIYCFKFLGYHRYFGGRDEFSEMQINNRLKTLSKEFEGVNLQDLAIRILEKKARK